MQLPSGGKLFLFYQYCPCSKRNIATVARLHFLTDRDIRVRPQKSRLNKFHGFENIVKIGLSCSTRYSSFIYVYFMIHVYFKVVL